MKLAGRQVSRDEVAVDDARPALRPVGRAHLRHEDPRVSVFLRHYLHGARLWSAGFHEIRFNAGLL